RAVPARDEGWQHGLIAAGRNAEEIDDRYPVLECLPKPAIVGCIRVLPHESVVDRLVTVENLPMHLALIVVPDFAAGLWEHGLNRQQESRLLRLEDAPLRVDERDSLAIEDETWPQLGRRQVIANFAQPTNVLEGGPPDQG